MGWDFDVVQSAAQIVYCYAGSGTILQAGVPLLELRLGNGPLQTLAYGESRSVVVKRVVPEVARPIGALPVSVPLAVVNTTQVGANGAPEAMLIVSIFRQGCDRVLLLLATWREEEHVLDLEVAPGRLGPSRLPPGTRAFVSRYRSLHTAVPGRRRRARL